MIIIYLFTFVMWGYAIYFVAKWSIKIFKFIRNIIKKEPVPIKWPKYEVHTTFPKRPKYEVHTTFPKLPKQNKFKRH